jgi:hypothetical protein
MFGTLRQDLGFSLRTLLKNIAFTFTAVLTLALGIGATTAMFSVVYAVFAPMPYPKPDQLVMVWSKVQGERNSVSPGDYVNGSDEARPSRTWGHGPVVRTTWLPGRDPNRLKAHRALQVSLVWKDCRCFSDAIFFQKKASRAKTM